MIAAELDRPELRSLRKTHRNLEQVASERLFKDMVVSHIEQSLDDPGNNAEHKSWRDQVRDITRSYLRSDRWIWCPLTYPVTVKSWKDYDRVGPRAECPNQWMSELKQYLAMLPGDLRVLRLSAHQKIRIPLRRFTSTFEGDLFGMIMRNDLRPISLHTKHGQVDFLWNARGHITGLDIEGSAADQQALTGLENLKQQLHNLKSLTFRSTVVSIDTLEHILTHNAGLERIEIHDATPDIDRGHNSTCMMALVGLFLILKSKGCVRRNFRVNIRDLQLPHHSGRFSVDEVRMRKWMNRSDMSLVKEAKDAILSKLESNGSKSDDSDRSVEAVAG